jgi:hypothetical protein
MAAKNSRILVISDLHEPYTHVDAVAFLTKIKEKYKPDRVVLSGDEVDYHAISFHDSDPDLPSAGDELKRAIRNLQPIYKLFPTADILDSNHGSLPFRKALANGLPVALMRSPGEALKAPKGWKWHNELIIKMSNGQQCYFHHSKGANVKRNSQSMGMSFVQGHHHESFEIQYWGNPNALMFGMTVGCLVDSHSLAMAYSKNNLRRPVIGLGLILDGVPKLMPMQLNKQGRWTGKVP